MFFDGYWRPVEKNTARILEEATDICCRRTHRLCPRRENVVLRASDSAVLAEGNFVISKEGDLNCFLTPWKRKGNNRWPVTKIMALFVLNLRSIRSSTQWNKW